MADSNTTRTHRRAAGLCVACGKLSARRICGDCKVPKGGRAKRRLRTGCPGCGHPFRPDGRCGVCEYLKGVAARGVEFQRVIDGSCVG